MNSAPALAGYPTSSSVLQSSLTSTLTIQPCHPLCSTTEMMPLAINPGLVSPSDSQSIQLRSPKDHTRIFPRPAENIVVPSFIPSPSANDLGKDFTVGPARLNKFVQRLHDMLVTEKDSGIVEWRRGLLVIFSTYAFSQKILPKYFNTRNFKTFRRQLNYYGFIHCKSFSATGSSTTALWINQELAKDEANDGIAAVLKLRRVEPNEAAKTVEGRRQRKELALHTVEEDIGLDSKRLQLSQIQSMAIRGEECVPTTSLLLPSAPLGSDDALELDQDVPRMVDVPSLPNKPGANHTGGEVVSDLLKMNSMESNSAAAATMLLMLARSS